MRTDKIYYLFREDGVQKATKLMYQNYLRKKRAPTRKEKFFGEKAAPEYANYVFPTIVEYVLNP